MLGDVLTLRTAVTPDLVTDRRRAAVEHSGNSSLTYAAQQADLNVGAFFYAEFVVGLGNTVPKWSAVSLGPSPLHSNKFQIYITAMTLLLLEQKTCHCSALSVIPPKSHPSITL